MKKLVYLATLALLAASSSYAHASQEPRPTGTEEAPAPSSGPQMLVIRIFPPDSGDYIAEYTVTVPAGSHTQVGGHDERPTPENPKRAYETRVDVTRIGASSNYRLKVDVNDPSKGGFSWRSDESIAAGVPVELNAPAARLFIAPGWSMTIRRAL